MLLQAIFLQIQFVQLVATQHWTGHTNHGDGDTTKFVSSRVLQTHQVMMLGYGIQQGLKKKI